MNKEKIIQIRVDVETYEEIKKLALKQKLTMSEFFRMQIWKLLRRL